MCVCGREVKKRKPNVLMSRLFKGYYGCTFGHISFSSDLKKKQEELRRKIHTRHLGVHVYQSVDHRSVYTFWDKTWKLIIICRLNGFRLLFCFKAENTQEYIYI